MNNSIYLGIQVAESLEITKVPGWVGISGLESGVVVADHGFEQVIEDAVGLSIRGVDTESRVQVLNTFIQIYILALKFMLLKSNGQVFWPVE